MANHLCWAILWRGNERHLVGEPNGTTRTKLFRTQSEAKAHIREAFGYIRHRKDLRVLPHNWRMPLAVRVSVNIMVSP